MNTPTKSPHSINSTSTPTNHLVRAILPNSNKSEKREIHVTSAADIIARQMVRMQRFRPLSGPTAAQRKIRAAKQKRLHSATAIITIPQKQVAIESRRNVSAINVSGSPARTPNHTNDSKPVNLATVRIPISGAKALHQKITKRVNLATLHTATQGTPKGKFTKRVDLSMLHPAHS